MSMPMGACRKTDCTVAATGRCLESHTTPGDCPNFVAQQSENGPVAEPATAASSTFARQFHSGLELGLSDALMTTRARYAHLVGILGATNSGKTCFLNSLYLLASRGRLLPEFRFAGSRTLQGFELRARHLRTWTGGSLPEQLADHTRLLDPRVPAFMHLALDQIGTGRIDLLLSDLPGEWTSHLVSRAATASRFDFLSRADTVCVVVEGPKLANDSTRHTEKMNAEQLIERLAGAVSLPRDTRFILLVTKADEIGMKLPAAVSAIQKRAEEAGFRPTVIATAAISRQPEKVQNGSGVLDVVRAIVEPAKARLVATATTPNGNRSYLRAGA